jgi:hypothetical protein
MSKSLILLDCNLLDCKVTDKSTSCGNRHRSSAFRPPAGAVRLPAMHKVDPWLHRSRSVSRSLRRSLRHRTRRGACIARLAGTRIEARHRCNFHSRSCVERLPVATEPRLRFRDNDGRLADIGRNAMLPILRPSPGWRADLYRSIGE